MPSGLADHVISSHEMPTSFFLFGKKEPPPPPPAWPPWHGDPHYLRSWEVLAYKHCFPYQLPWGIGRLRGAIDEAAPLVANRLPMQYWKTLMYIESTLKPTAQRVAEGQRPDEASLQNLANMVYKAQVLKDVAHKVVQLRILQDRMNPDTAVRIDTAMRNVEDWARFVFGVAYPCGFGKFGPLFKYTGEPGKETHSRWTPADIGEPFQPEAASMQELAQAGPNMKPPPTARARLAGSFM
mmetsp:Transcript_109536/g.200778  ORF Transcript_109536/g.200778 Transcript_109536/m.200778 type:complete len:239 (+) Transcript_109536:75-791(+)